MTLKQSIEYVEDHGFCGFRYTLWEPMLIDWEGDGYRIAEQGPLRGTFEEAQQDARMVRSLYYLR